ncbi:MAG: HDIG domain-containing protein [Cyclobacteriaceae bacterium]|nr:HDIG domain-containing protein [Cyclobacteriaceae bacterium]
MNAQQVTAEIFELYEKFGRADYIGEPVSQIEHMSQAAELALKSGADDEVILAAFFHDIGHICVQNDASLRMSSFGIKSHEEIGAGFLRSRGFSDRMAQLVENHVKAKRYLTYKYPAYFEQLSEASKQTLIFQGGIMSEKEAVAFEQDPLFEDSILLRKWDEAAKEVNVPIIDLEWLKGICLRVLTKA